ncbi:MAG: DUF938 domain-containing protein [Aquabacterium sp.]|nr:DUF938 domain-containing protein [Aquabacterium sp.]
MPDLNAAQTSPAADRNKGPILATLQALLPARGRLLELAAGTGQHAVHCAAGLPGWQWLPTDPSPDALASVRAWAQLHPAPGLLPALQLDVLQQPWPLPEAGRFDAIFCANMLHIAPWACCNALMQGAAAWLAPGGQLITYGPYFVEGEPAAPGNTAFDADLQARNPAWGIRWLHAVQAEAAAAGLQWVQRLALPANNQILVFRR